MDERPAYPTIAELERQHAIPPDRFCGLTPADMSRVVIACNSRPGAPGEPAGYWPIVSPEIQLDNLRAEFGPEADVARLRLLERHYPELSADARRVIAGGYSYSHAK